MSPLWLDLGACVVLYAALEYGVHRWDMHRPQSRRFLSHTVEHHGQGHMGQHQASLSLRNVAEVYLLTSPATLAIGWLLGSGSAFGICWALFLVWSSFAWTAVHRNIHGEPGYWYAWLLCPWLATVKWNHLRHHANPKRGFGGMFWFISDVVMGTV